MTLHFRFIVNGSVHSVKDEAHEALRRIQFIREASQTFYIILIESDGWMKPEPRQESDSAELDRS